MKVKKKVSVIISSYNHKKYLIEAVDSVLAQTMQPHEVIIADDCSSDGSVEVIKDYMQRFPHQVKAVLQKKNLGIPRNRNSALETVTGDYVYILDGDDRFLPRNIEVMMALVKDNPGLGAVYGNLLIIDSEGKKIHQRDYKEQPCGNIFNDVALAKFGMMRNMMMDFQLLKQIGFMDIRFPRYDGYDLTLRIAKQAPIGYVFQPLAEYRIHTTSDSRGLSGKDHLDDLSGIYEKMQPLIMPLPQEHVIEIRKTWRALILRFFLEFKIENEFLQFIQSVEQYTASETREAKDNFEVFANTMKKRYGAMELFRKIELQNIKIENQSREIQKMKRQLILQNKKLIEKDKKFADISSKFHQKSSD